jgi:TIR domain
MRPLPFDVFICHASEDKEAVARPLARILRSRGFSVWIDEVEMKLGDNLRQTIDAGLRASTFGAVILSPSFFEKRWPQWELDGLADREMSSGTKVVLPIWHEVDHDDVAAHSPSLAGKLAARTSDGVDRVADAVAEVLRGPTGATLEIDHVPRTPEEEAALLRARPSAWEYMLFAAVLRRELDALEPKYRDHELGYAPPGSGPMLDGAEATTFLSDAFRQVRGLLANFNRLMDPKSQELAFGPLGQAGDPAAIRHLAERVVDVYEGMLDWAARLRATAVAHRFRRALDLSSAVVSQPLRQFREFVAHAVSEIDRVQSLPDGEVEEPMTVVLTLTLSIEDGLADELGRELDRL